VFWKHALECSVREDKIHNQICGASFTCEEPTGNHSIFCERHRGKILFIRNLGRLKTNINLDKKRHEHYRHRLYQSSRKFSESRLKKTLSKAEIQELCNKIQEYREEKRLPIARRWLSYRDQWEKKSHDLVFLDTEYSNYSPGTTLLVEICLYNAAGQEIIDTIINHKCTIQALYDRSDCIRHRCLIRKVYGPPREEITPGMTIGQVADILHEYGFGNRTHIVEWSSSFCDYNHLYQALKSIQRDGLMPSKAENFRAMFAWRAALTDFPVSFRLSDLHRIVISK